MHPATVVSCITLALAPLLNWLLIFKLRLGLDGAVWAMNACQGISLALLSVYTERRHAAAAGSDRQTWHGWSREALTGWGAFLRLGVPSTVMVCLEWWAYEGGSVCARVRQQAMAACATANCPTAPTSSRPPQPPRSCLGCCRTLSCTLRPWESHTILVEGCI